MRANLNFFKIMNKYLLAIENEISIDSAQYMRMNVDSHRTACLPRPSRWASLYKKYGLLFVVFAHFLRAFWFVLVGCFYSIYEAFAFTKQWNHLRNNRLMRVQNYILAFSNRASKIVPQFMASEYAVITMPWEPAVASAKNTSLCAFVAPVDIARAFVFSIASILCMIIRGRSPWILQTFTAFRWFVAYAGISKLRGNFYIADHYDRWAVLADSIAGDMAGCKSRKDKKSAIRLSLVQHGSLKNLTMNDNSVFDITLGYRLRNIQELFVYDDFSKNIFLTYIIRNECVPKIEYFKPVISTVPMGRQNSRKLLFVGHPFSELLHCRIELFLRCFENIELYYKPHPKNPATSVVANRTWKIIKSVDVFPTVDYIVSYPSTLVNEYANIGISAFVHPLHVTDEDLNVQMDSFKKWFYDNFTVISNIHGLDLPCEKNE